MDANILGVIRLVVAYLLICLGLQVTALPFPDLCSSNLASEGWYLYK